MPKTSFLSYYVASLLKVVRSPLRSITFFSAIVTSSLAHTVLGLSAAAVAATLAGTRSGTAPTAPTASLLVPHISPLSLTLMGLVAAVVKGGGSSYATHVQSLIAGDAATELRSQILRDLLATYRARSRQGDHGGDPPREAAALAALTDRVREVELGMSRGLLSGVRSVAQLLPVVVGLFVLVPTLAMGAVTALLPFGLLLGQYRRRWRAANERMTDGTTRLLGAAGEAVKHADLWVVSGAGGVVLRHVARLGGEIARRSAAIEASGVALSSMNEVMGAVAVLIVVALAAHTSLGAQISGGDLLLFVLLFFLAYRPLRDLGDARLAMDRARAAYDAITATVRQVDGTEAASDPVPTVWPKRELRLDALTLSHGDLPPLSLDVPFGSLVVILGPTGTGKTTLLRTLLGLEPLTSGSIRYGGVALSESEAGPDARPFAWMPQDSPIFATTLAANIDVRSRGVDTGAILASLGATRLVGELSGELLGAGDRPLSGGERQLVALARALAEPAPVLLLDEPTSAMDPETQAAVMAALRSELGARTILLVTHRRELAERADIVVRLGDPHRITVLSDRRASPADGYDEGTDSTVRGGPADTVTSAA